MHLFHVWSTLPETNIFVLKMEVSFWCLAYFQRLCWFLGRVNRIESFQSRGLLELSNHIILSPATIDVRGDLEVNWEYTYFLT